MGWILFLVKFTLKSEISKCYFIYTVLSEFVLLIPGQQGLKLQRFVFDRSNYLMSNYLLLCLTPFANRRDEGSTTYFGVCICLLHLGFNQGMGPYGSCCLVLCLDVVANLGIYHAGISFVFMLLKGQDTRSISFIFDGSKVMDYWCSWSTEEHHWNRLETKCSF